MARQVFQSAEYSTQYDQFKTQYPRLLDVQAGVDWALYTNAEKLESVSEDGDYCLVKTENVEGQIPGFRILAHLFENEDGPVAELIAIDEIPRLAASDEDE